MHYYGTKLVSYMRRLEGEAWPKEDKSLIRNYIAHCRAQGLSVGVSKPIGAARPAS